MSARRYDWAPWAIAAGLVGLGSAAVIVQLAPTLRERSLEAETLRRYLELKQRLSARGIKLHTGSTTRTPEQQAAALERGTSSTSISWHMVGRAVDAYPIDPTTGKPDLAGRRGDLFRAMHEEAARLGFHGLAYKPYPSGPLRYLQGPKGKFWDGAHLEFHGPYISAAQAWKAEQAA